MLYVKNTKDIIFFPIFPLGAIRYSCPIRLVPTYILPAKDIRLLGKLQPNSFKTERLVCVETNGQMDRRTWLVMLFKNIRGQSDKYLASPPDGVTIAREIYYRVVHSRRRLLSKFQPNRTRNFVLTACGIGRVRGFQKNGERAISVTPRFPENGYHGG